MTTTPGPRTEAGRRLFTDVDPMDMLESDGVTWDDILAIEAEARADVDGLVALHDVVMTIESMTWGRVFPAEPTPSTRDLVVFTAALGAAKRRVALLAGDKAALPDGEVITDANGDELEHGAGDKAEAPR